MQFSFGKELLRAAISLGFLGCLIVSGSLTSQAAKSVSLTVATQVLANAAGATAPGTFAFDVDSSDSTLTNPSEIGVDDSGVAFEDSVELRFNIQQRTVGLDHAEIGSKIASTAAEKTRPNISPPLLV